ncbi:hypothetical protein DFR86_05080 [Acidianus sulfidivorans JP7]|uniref:hypothetical protein n=1 Tax=Acidianus sulfidivorans TaxID=312539 RepID=UPI0013A593EF|nr:hypothetical protein [Acidianus sulfidivorans]AWR96993.2 hypothetical protein DFR86_05080 [Acidianus sulfidivorans JP7]
MKLVYPTIATASNITKEAYEKINNSADKASEATKLLFRQGLLIKTTKTINEQEEPIMIYIGGISPYWRAGTVSAYQYRAERRFKYSQKVRDAINRHPYLGLLVGKERVKRPWINPPNPTQQTIYTAYVPSLKPEVEMQLQNRKLVNISDDSNYRCSRCTVAAHSASDSFTLTFLPVFNGLYYFNLGGGTMFVGIGYPGNSFDKYYDGSPLLVSNCDECGEPYIGGFVTETCSLSKLVNLNKLTSQSLNINTNYISSSSLFEFVPPPKDWSLNSIYDWAMYYLAYERGFLDSLINFAVILGILLRKYPEDIANDIEDAIYEDDYTYACSDYNECYEELSRVVEDFRRALYSEEEKVVRFCRDSATYVDNSCINSCVSKAYNEIKTKSVYLREHFGYGDEDFMDLARSQCNVICTKFDAKKYDECIERLYPRKGPHIGE